MTRRSTCRTRHQFRVLGLAHNAAVDDSPQFWGRLISVDIFDYFAITKNFHQRQALDTEFSRDDLVRIGIEVNQQVLTAVILGQLCK